jgi:anion-transporting  ArsA/GET3 family ATPase
MAMEKLYELHMSGEFDLLVLDTPPTRNALDFLDAPERLGRFLDGRLIRVLLSPAKATRPFAKVLNAGFSMMTGALTKLLGAQVLRDAQTFVTAFDTMFGGFRERADATYRLLQAPGTSFLVVAAPEPDALREASYFVERLDEERMPLAGLILNRTHPILCDLHGDKAQEAAEEIDGTGADALTAAVLHIHADRAATAKREIRLLSRFTGANPHVAIVGVPSLPFDVSDLDALRAIADQITGEAASAA